MHITVRFLAGLRDTIGTGQVTLDIPDGASLHDVVDQLVVRYPALAGHQTSWHFAVNRVYAEADTRLHAGDRIAIFPYVAGG